MRPEWLLLGKTRPRRLPLDEALNELAARALLPTELPKLLDRALRHRCTPAELKAWQEAERQFLRMEVDSLLDDPPWALSPRERDLLDHARAIPRDKLVARLLDPFPARTRPLRSVAPRGVARTTPARNGARTGMGARGTEGWQGRRVFPVVPRAMTASATRRAVVPDWPGTPAYERAQHGSQRRGER